MLDPGKIKFLEQLVSKGGPDTKDYEQFTWIVNQLTEDQKEIFREIIKDSLTSNTLIGHGFVKPYGYPGDFCLIDNIYKQKINPDPAYSNWDRFFQDQPAAQAVRNRKDFFLENCQRLEDSDRQDLNVLILGCGPATDVNEYLLKHSNSRIKFDLIDFDQNALDFAYNQNKQFNGSILYIRMNVLRFKAFKLYDLIWSAGLFDYFKEKHFKYLINKYMKVLSVDGEFIIGNFSNVNPTRKLMEVLSDWYLNHRSKFDLIRMAIDAEAKEELVEVENEKLGINLFLKIKNQVNGQKIIRYEQE